MAHSKARRTHWVTVRLWKKINWYGFKPPGKKGREDGGHPTSSVSIEIKYLNFWPHCTVLTGPSASADFELSDTSTALPRFELLRSFLFLTSRCICEYMYLWIHADMPSFYQNISDWDVECTIVIIIIIIISGDSGLTENSNLQEFLISFSRSGASAWIPRTL